MLKSMYVHFLNKFPGAQVVQGENFVSAHCRSSGALLMKVIVNGLGQMVCAQKESGARYPFCNSPIPKEARAMKLYADGSVGPAEEHAERSAAAKVLCEKHGGVVPSELQLKWAGKRRMVVDGANVIKESEAFGVPSSDHAAQMEKGKAFPA